MLKVIIAAGGSGGHIYPGLSLAQGFLKINSDVDILFWGYKNQMESQLIPAAGYKLLTTKIGRLNSNVPLYERLLTLLQLPLAILKAIYVIIRHKPSIVVGMGGHASAPLLLAAKVCGVRSFLWEPNVYPGLANRTLSRFVDECFIVFEESRNFLKSENISNTGFLIRDELEEQPTKKNFKKNHEKLKVLILGGSQGSASINRLVSKMIINHPEVLDCCEVTHQVGSTHFESMKGKYLDLDVDMRAYVEDIPKAMRWADLIISRAGASTIAELAASSLTGIFIPLSSSSDDHQVKNAKFLDNNEAGLMLSEVHTTSEELFEIFIGLAEDPERIKKMSQNIHKLHQPRAAESLAQSILKR